MPRIDIVKFIRIAQSKYTNLWCRFVSWRNKLPQFFTLLEMTSVTRLGDLLHIGQLYKANGNNYLAQIAHIVRQFV